MSLATYSDLQTAVANWLARASDTVITANVADFITLCESRIAYGYSNAEDPDNSFYSPPLRIRAMEREVPLVVQAVQSPASVGGTPNAITLTTGQSLSSNVLGNTWNFTALSTNTSAVTIAVDSAPAANLLKGSSLSALGAGDIVAGSTVQIYFDGTEFVLMPGTGNVPLPNNFLAMRSLYIDANPRVKLDYIGPEQLNTLFAATDVGTPSTYTIEGDVIRLGRPPDTAYNLPCLYYQKFPALATASTNWLMTNAPNVYLHGSLLEASIFLGDNNEAQRWLRLYRSGAIGLQTQNERDRHSGATLVIRNDSGNP